MSVIKLTPVVAAIADVAKVFDRIMVYRSTEGKAGPFLPITTRATSLAINANQTVYEYEDLNGDESYYYCLQYLNVQTGAVSGLSDAQMGSGNAYLGIISVDQLKTNYLFGVDLTDPQGNPIPESFFTFFLASAASWVEKQLDIPLVPTSVVDERHDWTQTQRTSYSWIQLDRHPVISVDSVRIAYPGQPLSDVLPPQWVVLDKDKGSVQLVPGGASSFAFNNGMGLGAYPWSMGPARYIPNFYSVTYSAGFLPNQCPPEIADLVGMTAAIPVLDVAGDLLGGAGIASQSISIDGLSQSINTTSSPMYSGYGARVNLYNDGIKEKIAVLRQYYRGMGLAVS